MIVFVIAHLNSKNFSVNQWKKNIIIVLMRMETDIEKHNNIWKIRNLKALAMSV